MKNSNRVLIFIVAYNAQKHISDVLKRIPDEIFNKYNVEILIIDDASDDQTFEVSLSHRHNDDYNITILKNPINQGYGGNQKLGYHYSLKNNFDAVVMLHGDGQYAPEVIEDIFSPIIEGTADMVMGSRMLLSGSARKGGMPLYKYLGNKILTFLQNILLKSNISEFHSGYRAYSTALLKKIPFEFNDNDFHFDTQIIIQMMLAKARIVEVPIPTYYGDEICHVNGIKYAWNVIKQTILSRLQQLGITHQKSYDLTPEIPYRDKSSFDSSHMRVIQRIESGSRILSIGCGSGFIEKHLKKKGCSITGWDQSALPEECASFFDSFYPTNLDDLSQLPELGKYDYILLCDIIEHLQEPEKFMLYLRECIINPETKLIITLPNIAFSPVRLQLLLGNFNYAKSGILDFTHRRLFTFKSARKLLKSCGFQITRTAGIPAPFPLAVKNKLLSQGLLKLNSFLCKISKGLFSFQIYYEARPLPMINQLLDKSIEYSQILEQKNCDNSLK